jgi:hypothetical protein
MKSSKRARQHPDDVLSFCQTLKRDQYGTSGGWTKSVRTLSKIPDKKSSELVAFLQREPTSLNFIKTKFWFYDLLY